MRKVEREPIEEIEEESASYTDDPLFNISSFGTDISFRELITMYDENELIKPEMQRRYVWSKLEASRFIDSILLGLPIPSIFLAKSNDEKRLIVDGYQRIMTVYDYVQSGHFSEDDKNFTLSDSVSINKKWRGKSFYQLTLEEQRRIKNYPIHAIVFEQKEPRDDTGMYQIFERINTGGRSLKPQEIRNCVYHGRFNTALIAWNKSENWRKIWGKDCDSRMYDVELILRMLAFSNISQSQVIIKKQISLAEFLNDFMRKANYFEKNKLEQMRSSFDRNIVFLIRTLEGKKIFRRVRVKKENISFMNKINPAVADSVYAATDYYLSQQNNQFIDDFSSRYIQLFKDDNYIDAISNRTTSIENIKRRIDIACKILYGIKYEW